MIALVLIGFGIWLLIRTTEPSFQGRSLNSWLKTCGKYDISLPTEARVAVQHIGSNAVPHLLKRLRSEDSGWEKLAIRFSETQQMEERLFATAHEEWFAAVAGFRALGAAGASAIPDLTAMLADTNRVFEASRSLAGIGIAAVPTLTNALRSKDPKIRASIVAALGDLGTNGASAVPSLLMSLHDTNARVRDFAASSLGWIKAEPDSVIPALTALLTDRDAGVRRSTVTSIGYYGPRAKSALNSVLLTVEDASEGVRHSAAWAVSSITEQSTTPVFLLRLTNPSPATRRAAIYALSIFTYKDSNVVAALTNVVHDTDGGVRKDAEALLKRIDRKAAKEAGIQ